MSRHDPDSLDEALGRIERLVARLRRIARILRGVRAWQLR